jgi:hypothetical protein
MDSPTSQSTPLRTFCQTVRATGLHTTSWTVRLGHNLTTTLAVTEKQQQLGQYHAQGVKYGPQPSVGMLCMGELPSRGLPIQTHTHQHAGVSSACSADHLEPTPSNPWSHPCGICKPTSNNGYQLQDSRVYHKLTTRSRRTRHQLHPSSRSHAFKACTSVLFSVGQLRPLHPPDLKTPLQHCSPCHQE